MKPCMTLRRINADGAAVLVTGWRLIPCAALLLLLAGTSQARQLSPKEWTFSEIESGKRLGPEMADNDLRTAWVSRTADAGQRRGYRPGPKGRRSPPVFYIGQEPMGVHPGGSRWFSAISRPTAPLRPH